MKYGCGVLVFSVFSMCWAAIAPGGNAARERIKRSDAVLRQFQKAAPTVVKQLLSSSLCFVVCPRRASGETSSGMQGFLRCRAEASSSWGNPAAVIVEGGGVGWTFMGSQLDVLLIATEPSTAAALKASELTIGANPLVQPGPVTADQVPPQFNKHAELFAYSISSDGIMGIQMGGATIREDATTNAEIYGKKIGTAAVLASPVKAGIARDAEMLP